MAQEHLADPGPGVRWGQEVRAVQAALGVLVAPDLWGLMVQWAWDLADPACPRAADLPTVLARG